MVIATKPPDLSSTGVVYVIRNTIGYSDIIYYLAINPVSPSLYILSTVLRISNTDGYNITISRENLYSRALKSFIAMNMLCLYMIVLCITIRKNM